MLTELALGHLLLMVFLLFQLPQAKLLTMASLLQADPSLFLHCCPSIDLGSSSFSPDKPAQSAFLRKGPPLAWSPCLLEQAVGILAMWKKSQGLFIFPWPMRSQRANSTTHLALWFLRRRVDYTDERRNARVEGKCHGNPWSESLSLPWATLWWSWGYAV